MYYRISTNREYIFGNSSLCSKCLENVHLYSDPSSQDWCKSARLSTSLRINWRTENREFFYFYISAHLKVWLLQPRSRIQIQLQMLSVFEIRKDKIWSKDKNLTTLWVNRIFSSHLSIFRCSEWMRIMISGLIHSVARDLVISTKSTIRQEKHKYTNTNTQIQIQIHKYTNTNINTPEQIQKMVC